VSAFVVGLDLAMGKTGVAERNGATRTIEPGKHAAGDNRLAVLAADVAHSVVGADLVVIEEAPPGLKGPAIKAIHMVHGAIRLGLMGSGLRYITVNPTTLKLFATGKRGATKADMALALYKRFALELADDNQVDAFWLRAAGLHLLGEPVFPLPAAQVAALDVVRGQLAGAP
jgi:hypothetical protein